MPVPRGSKKIAEKCIRELKVHGLMKDGIDVDTYDITEKAECLVIEAIRKIYPKASERDVKFRALIFGGPTTDGYRR